MPDESEALGLLALMLIQHARCAARFASEDLIKPLRVRGAAGADPDRGGQRSGVGLAVL
jgi:hypothetical protein